MKREILTTKKYRKDLKTALKSSTFDIDVFRDVIENCVQILLWMLSIRTIR